MSSAGGFLGDLLFSRRRLGFAGDDFGDRRSPLFSCTKGFFLGPGPPFPPARHLVFSGIPPPPRGAFNGSLFFREPPFLEGPSGRRFSFSRFPSPPPPGSFIDLRITASPPLFFPSGVSFGMGCFSRSAPPLSGLFYSFPFSVASQIDCVSGPLCPPGLGGGLFFFWTLFFCALCGRFFSKMFS